MLGQFTNKALAHADLQRTYNWDVQLPDVGGFDGNQIAMFVQDVGFSDYNLDDLFTLRHGALQTHAAGYFSISTVTMTFLCPTNSLVTSYFSAWKSLMFDVNSLCYFPKANYAMPYAYVNLYDNTGGMVAQYLLKNIFPKTFPKFKLSYSEQEMLKFDIEFSVDFINY